MASTFRLWFQLSIAAAHPPLGLDAKGRAQRITSRAGACDRKAFEVALKGRGADLAVHRAMVFLGDLGAGGQVQLIERQPLLALEHRQKPPLDPGPQVLLLAVDTANGVASARAEYPMRPVPR